MRTLTLFVKPTEGNDSAAFVTMPMGYATMMMLKKLARALTAVNKAMVPHAQTAAVTVSLAYYLTWWDIHVWDSPYLSKENGFSVRKPWIRTYQLQTGFSAEQLKVQSRGAFNPDPVIATCDNAATISSNGWVHFTARRQYETEIFTSRPFELAEILTAYAKETKR